MHYTPIKYSLNVYTYQQVLELAKSNYEGDLEKELTEYTASLQQQGTDSRDIGMLVTKRISAIARLEAPAIVLFFAPPYCPHNTLKEEVPDESVLINRLEQFIDEFGAENDLNYKMLRFFPSLSDSSYLKVDDSAESVDYLFSNFVQQKQLYPVPIDKIRALNIPAINFGTYGKDAHKWTERVNKPYTFGILPELVKKALLTFLQ